ncbi:MAG: NADPH-dependent FMN reductase, partial [Halobacteriota archaeon]
MTDVHVAAVCGSLRDRSYTRLALEHLTDSVRDSGGTAELLDLRAYDLPPIDPDRDDQGDSTDLTRRLR